MSISERDRDAIWHPYTQMKLYPQAIAIVKAHGAKLFDQHGKSYIDAISSWWVNLHGHAHPVIAEAITNQAAKLEQVIFAGFTHEAAVNLAEELLKLLPGANSKIFYSDNGSTAVEVALKIALQFWSNQGCRDRKRIIALDGAYHGDTFGAMAASARGLFTKAYEELLFNVYHIPYPLKGSEEAAIDGLEREVAKGDVAAFIYEPLIQGASGMRIYSAQVLDRLLTICKNNQVILIADEVMTGFGRTGKLFASEYCQTKPDIICLSKGITGGFLPLGVTSVTAEIYRAFLSDQRSKTLFHGHSYTANPLACAAALASLKLLKNSKADRDRITEAHGRFIQANSSNSKTREMRGLGTILAFEISSNEASGYFHSLRDKLYDFYLEHGVLLRPLGNTVYVLPPYCISDGELEQVYNVILRSLKEVL